MAAARALRGELTDPASVMSPSLSTGVRKLLSETDMDLRGPPVTGFDNAPSDQEILEERPVTRVSAERRAKVFRINMYNVPGGISRLFSIGQLYNVRL